MKVRGGDIYRNDKSKRAPNGLKKNNAGLNPEVWGPHYWFMIHTITLNYPHYPNDVTKKKYYDFIQNLPMFIPVSHIASEFSNLLDKYPVSPYLDSRDAFIRWGHFIHNKINEKLEKPQLSLHDFYSSYYEAYKPKTVQTVEYYKMKQKAIYLVMVLMIGSGIYYLYDK
jgi:hypothetical protein